MQSTDGPGVADGVFQCSSASRKFLNHISSTPRGPVLEFQCSSASRKFLNYADKAYVALRNNSFSALQRAENSSIPRRQTYRRVNNMFQCSSASRKFLNSPAFVNESPATAVSVLFSEPKIPQWRQKTGSRDFSTRVSVLFSEPKIPQYGPLWTAEAQINEFQCSSASRKFLNLIAPREDGVRRVVSVLFSEPKIPQSQLLTEAFSVRRRFSALQRAENSSIVHPDAAQVAATGFSALQRAENSSIVPSPPPPPRHATAVSVLFSEPKIPQSRSRRTIRRLPQSFSALQRAENSSIRPQSRAQCYGIMFQCSSASRKFLNLPQVPRSPVARSGFQCSSASRKFLNPAWNGRNTTGASCFSALQRAENSSIAGSVKSYSLRKRGFSALQRAENSSIPTLAPASIHISDRDDHASSFLSLPGASP